jgi:hypothetical protein
MSKHPSREQLIQYRERTLSASDLVAVDGHLFVCLDCRRSLAELATLSSATAMVSAIREAEGDHLTYDQMDAWLEDELDQSGRELVMAHIGLCSPCARQLRAYQAYAPVMSAPVLTPATPVASFAERLRAFLHNPRVVAVAAAAVVLAVLSPLVLVKRTETARREFAADLRSNGSASRPVTQALDTTELDVLPTPLRAGALAALNAPSSVRPSALLGLPPNSDRNLEYPVSEVVEETQPDLRWNQFDGVYVVSVYDASHRLIAQSPMLSETHWRVPAQLTRGVQYTWEVQGGAMVHAAAFRVLGRSEWEELSSVREKSPGPLAMGAAAQSLGLLSLAQQEFQIFSQQGSQSQQGAILLDRVTSLRGR